MTKAVVKTLGIIAGVMAIAGGIAIALNWTYLRRVATHPEDMITNTGWYKPLTKVSGKPTALGAGESKAFSDDSLNKIATYAKTHNSSAVNKKQIVPASWIKIMTQSSSLESSYGYHIWVEAKTKNKSGISRRSSQPFIAQDTIYLDGKSLQRVYVIPSQDLVIVRIGEQSQGWDDSVIVNTLISDLS